MANRSAIVTGASRGLGRELAARLAGDGWEVVIDARTRHELESAAVDIARDAAGRVVARHGDVRDPDHAAALVDAAVDLAPLRLLVNNASMLGPSPQPRLADYPLDVFGAVLETNVVAPLQVIQLALPALRATRGTIVNVTSDAALEPYEGWGGYGSSKAALEQLSRILAAEEPDVRVLWVDPGDMNTRMHQEAFPGEDISDRPVPATRVPGLLRLIDGQNRSGRYRVEDLLAEVAI